MGTYLLWGPGHNYCANSTLSFSKHPFSGPAFLHWQPLLSISFVSKFPNGIDHLIAYLNFKKSVGRKYILLNLAFSLKRESEEFSIST